jgi:hypothetical protein
MDEQIRRKLRFEGKFFVGQYVKAMDFRPRPGTPPCYYEGEIVDVTRPGAPVGGYVLRVTKRVWEDVPQALESAGELVLVPYEVALSDYDGRIVQIQPDDAAIRARIEARREQLREEYDSGLDGPPEGV